MMSCHVMSCHVMSIARSLPEEAHRKSTQVGRKRTRSLVHSTHFHSFSRATSAGGKDEGGGVGGGGDDDADGMTPPSVTLLLLLLLVVVLLLLLRLVLIDFVFSAETNPKRS